LAKNWLTKRSINFYFSTQQQLSAGRNKFGDINNNQLLIINLTSVPADGNANISSSPSLSRYMQLVFSLGIHNFVQLL